LFFEQNGVGFFMKRKQNKKFAGKEKEEKLCHEKRGTKSKIWRKKKATNEKKKAWFQGGEGEKDPGDEGREPLMKDLEKNLKIVWCMGNKGDGPQEVKTTWPSWEKKVGGIFVRKESSISWNNWGRNWGGIQVRGRDKRTGFRKKKTSTS